MDFLKKLFKRRTKVVARHRDPSNTRSPRKKEPIAEEIHFFDDLREGSSL